MRYPIDNWNTTKRGYSFGIETFYHTLHLGLDLIVSTGTKIYAPTDGFVKRTSGLHGGNQIHFTNERIIRFMHLIKFDDDKYNNAKEGDVKEGDLIGFTGNTGKYTTGPHLHVDVSIDKALILHLSNFIDPEKYFRSDPKITPQTPFVSGEFTVRVEKPEAFVRIQPNSKAALGGSKTLRLGDTFKVVGTVFGETFNGNNIWYRSAKNNYVWSGGLRKI